jgi:DNA (cytosine-5)-methyltransferase 1
VQRRPRRRPAHHDHHPTVEAVVTRPRLVDLFCGAGGAAMGYHLAGFDVVGVDVVAQPRYPFPFIQADAMTYPLDGFDAVHASPPCQHYANVTRWRGDQTDHPDLLPDTVARLTDNGVPWVVENVPGAPLTADFLLCGSHFGLPVRRHRWFTAPWAPLILGQPCRHTADALPFGHKWEQAYALAMGCGWMTTREARQAIPPAYTCHIGTHLLAAVTV